MDNQHLYKLSITFLDKLLRDGLINQSEHYKTKLDLKRTYKITEDIVPCG